MPILPERGLAFDFTMAELTTEIESLKCGKACGLDDFGTELIMHFGMSAKRWKLEMFNSGKYPADPKSYRPISLLCHRSVIKPDSKHRGWLLEWTCYGHGVCRFVCRI